MLSEDGSITKFITKIKKFPSVTRKKMSDVKWNYSDVVVEKEEKKFWYKIEDSLYDEEEEDLRRIRSHVMNEVDEEKEEKYKQLEFEFEEDLVAPI